MPSWTYSYAGLRVVSELRIPEWEVFGEEEPCDHPDVRITLEDPASGAEGGETVRPEEVRFFVPEAGRFRVCEGREIRVAPAVGLDAPEIRLFLLGSAWGALCYQRGLLVLHASVVQVGPGAVAFLGPSGAGKSSLAAGLVAQGYPLVGDDLCCIDLAGQVPRVHPSAPRLKLWSEALGRLGWSTDGLARDHVRVDKFHVDLKDLKDRVATGAPGTLALRSVYLLEWGQQEVVRLSGVGGLRRLIRSATYRPGFLGPLGRTATYWEQCAKLARAVPVWEFRRPRDWSQASAAIDLLAGGWDELRRGPGAASAATSERRSGL